MYRIRAADPRSLRRPLVAGTLTLLTLMVGSAAALGWISRTTMTNAALEGADELALNWTEHESLTEATHAADRVADALRQIEVLADSIALSMRSQQVTTTGAEAAQRELYKVFDEADVARHYDTETATYAVARWAHPDDLAVASLEAHRAELARVANGLVTRRSGVLHVAVWVPGAGVVGHHLSGSCSLSVVNLRGGFGAEVLVPAPFEGPHWTGPDLRPDGTALLTYTVPVRGAGEGLRGLVRVDIDASVVHERLAVAFSGLLEPAPLLLDSQCTVVAAAPQAAGALGAEHPDWRRVNNNLQQAVRELLTPEDLAAPSPRGEIVRRTKRFVAIAAVPDHDWIVAVVTPLGHQTALAVVAAEPSVSAAQSMSAVLLLFAIVFGIVAALGGLYFADWLRRRIAPILEGARELAAGNLDHRIALHGDDEITAVAVALNSSAVRLDQTVMRLEESKRRLSGLIQGMAEGLLITDGDDRISFVNARFAELLGRPAEALKGHYVEEFLVPDSLETYRREMRLRREGESSRYEVVWLAPGSGMRRTIVAGMPLYDQASRYCGTCGVVTDITHRARAQEEMARAEKLRALGEMAGGVAHDFNNLLTAVLGNTQYLMGEELPDTALEPLRVIERAALDGTETVRRIREFTKARTRVAVAEPVDANALIWDAVLLARPRIDQEARDKGVRYEVIVHRTARRSIRGNPSELRETLVNLVNNAIDAMPQGGELNVEAFDRGEDTVGLRVEDEGEGIAPEAIDKIFDPFFSTKRDNRCSGLGLSICYGIVRAHEGRIDVRSTPGVGTAFTAVLPAYAPSLSRIPARELGPAVPPPPSVLYVAPLTERSRQLQRALEGVGVDVVLIEGGDAAEKAFADPRMVFNVLMTENEMDPRAGGWELARKARGERPELRIVLLADPTPPVDESQARNAGIDATLTRPFDAAEVYQALARLLASPTPRRAAQIGHEEMPPTEALDSPTMEGVGTVAGDAPSGPIDDDTRRVDDDEDSVLDDVCELEPAPLDETEAMESMLVTDSLTHSLTHSLTRPLSAVPDLAGATSTVEYDGDVRAAADLDGLPEAHADFATTDVIRFEFDHSAGVPARQRPSEGDRRHKPTTKQFSTDPTHEFDEVQQQEIRELLSRTQTTELE